MQKTAFVAILLWCGITATNAQLYKVLYNIPKGVSAQADNFGHVYLLQRAKFSLLNDSGSVKATYSNFSLGAISSADASNPSHILLWYQPLNQVVFLDRNLTQIEKALKLDNYGVNNTLAVCSSTEASFWLLDAQQQKLLCFNPNMSTVFNSNLLMFINNFQPDGCYLRETSSGVVLYIRGQGLHLFDKYGNYLTQIPIVQDCNFTCSGNEAIIAQEGKIYGISLSTYRQTFEFDVPADEEWFPLDRKLFVIHSTEKDVVVKLLTK
jgi:hypothetical protein